MRLLRGIAAFLAISVAGYLVARRVLLDWGATPDERKRPLPGDDEVVGPAIAVTHAVTIDAPPSAVWPWLVQIGTGRAGWYSYTWVERMMGVEVKNLDRIVPELQTLAVGDVIPLAPGITVPVASIRPERHLLLVGHDPKLGDVSWIFALDSFEGDRTRLVSRMRLRFPTGTSGMSWTALADLGAALMDRGMLVGIKRRAERAARAEAEKIASV